MISLTGIVDGGIIARSFWSDKSVLHFVTTSARISLTWIASFVPGAN
jgi:hypothetical protein